MELNFFSSLTEYLKTLITLNLYGGAFLAALIETIFPPIPSEIVMPLAGYLASLGNYGYLGLILVSVFATLGATLGAVIIYFVSLKLGRLFIIKYGKYLLITESSLSSAEKWFGKYGSKAVFFGRMAPGIRELVSIPAGISKMKFEKFLFYTFLGSFIWTTVLVSLGYFLGVYVESLNLSGIFSKIGIFLLAIIIIYFVIKLVAKRFEKKNKL
jgi:membrane protein DedA with SNARE-associated domain